MRYRYAREVLQLGTSGRLPCSHDDLSRQIVLEADDMQRCFGLKVGGQCAVHKPARPIEGDDTINILAAASKEEIKRNPEERASHRFLNKGAGKIDDGQAAEGEFLRRRRVVQRSKLCAPFGRLIGGSTPCTRPP